VEQVLASWEPRLLLLLLHKVATISSHGVGASELGAAAAAAAAAAQDSELKV